MIVQIINFEQIIDAIRNDSIYNFVIVKFFADWCGPCRRLARVIEEIELKRKDVLFLNVDIDKFRDIAKNEMFNVTSIPSMFIFQNKKFLKRIDGSIDFEALERSLELEIVKK